jgi:hypothetical protein
MKVNLIAAAAAAALLASNAALAQATAQADVPSSARMNSAHANAPSTSGQPGYSTGGPRANPTYSAYRMNHPRRSAMHRSTAAPASPDSQPRTSSPTPQPRPEG